MPRESAPTLTLSQEGRTKELSNTQGLNVFLPPIPLVLEVPGKCVSSENGRGKKEEDLRARKRECTERETKALVPRVGGAGTSLQQGAAA